MDPGPPVAPPVLAVPASASILVRLVGGDSELRKLFGRNLALDFLDENAIAAYEVASSSFYQTNLPDGFQDVTAVLDAQFIDQGGELSTVAQVTAIQSNSFLDLQEELISVVNGNPDSFIAALQANEPDSFADVVDVEAFDPAGLVPAIRTLTGTVLILVFAISELLSGTALEVYETATTEFYQNFLPSIYTNIEATLETQFLEAQELTTVMQVNADALTPAESLELLQLKFSSELTLLLNANQDAFINQLTTLDPVSFGGVVRVNAESVPSSAVPSMAPGMLVNDAPNTDSDVLVCDGKGKGSSKKSSKGSSKKRSKSSKGSSKKSSKGSGGMGKKQKGCKTKEKSSKKKSLKSSSISKSKSASETFTSDSFSSKSKRSDVTKERNKSMQKQSSKKGTVKSMANKLRRGNW